MKQDLYDTTFTLFSLASGNPDANGDATVTKTQLATYPCQIDNLTGNDQVRYGKNNELATHLIFCDLIAIDSIDPDYEIVCQGMQLDISFIARNEGGLTSATHGLEIYCIFRSWVPTSSIT